MLKSSILLPCHEKQHEESLWKFTTGVNTVGPCRFTKRPLVALATGKLFAELPAMSGPDLWEDVVAIEVLSNLSQNRAPYKIQRFIIRFFVKITFLGHGPFQIHPLSEMARGAVALSNRCSTLPQILWHPVTAFNEPFVYVIAAGDLTML